MPLALSFEEAINGLTTNITVNRSEQCSRCNGAGDIGGPVMICSTCKGSGQVQKAGGRLRFAQECTDCEGTGRRRSPCSLCKGKGTLPKTETVKVRIPAGVETGSRVKIPGKGEAGRLGAPAGDLHINTNVGSHKHFTRKGDNIYVTVPITVPEAALGSKIEVPTVEGKAQLRIPPGTQSGQKFRLASAGRAIFAQTRSERRSVCGSAGDATEGDLRRDQRAFAAVLEDELGESARRDGTGIHCRIPIANCRFIQIQGKRPIGNRQSAIVK